MKNKCKILLIIIIALLFFVQSGCQEQTKALSEVQDEIQITTTRAEITFEKTIHDFGKVSSTRKYKGEFKFKNTGSEILKIIKIKKCCGTIVTLDKEELTPGESGILKVEYITGRKEGLINRQITVFSNDKTKPKVELTIKAEVVIKIDYQPQRINLLLNKENSGCPEITIRSVDKQPFSITSFQSTGNVITADIDSSVEADKFVLWPKVDPDKHQKHPSGLISINLTHSELNRITIRFSTKKRYQLKPTGVYLLNPRPQKPNINKVSITSNYDEDFEIESTSSEKGTAKVIRQRTIADGYQLYVEITPPPPDETHSFDDIVNVNLKGGQTLRIKCYVHYLSKKEK